MNCIFYYEKMGLKILSYVRLYNFVEFQTLAFYFWLSYQSIFMLGMKPPMSLEYDEITVTQLETILPTLSWIKW